MNRYALTFTVRPGSEPEVSRILSSYGRPAAGRAPGGPPLLRRTSVFLAGNRVIRVVDVDGRLRDVVAHLAEQPQIKAVEDALDPYLEQPRDLTHADGVRAFLYRALLPVAHDRHTPPGLLPVGPSAHPGNRVALLYPARPGSGGDLAELLAGTRVLAPASPTTLARTTVFRRGDVVLRLAEVHGDPGEALDRIAEAAVRSGSGDKLATLVAADENLHDTGGFRAFLERISTRLLTDRRIGAPA
ncbi:SchA/CurD-like domain-containing protein [Streptomyces avicenniae]|uniref:SchA/CurD-like domain-containing protein n=1 Tax=Streptomyces avicenniae TaxID=500153 RepID=UPI00069B48B9|nr:SchA/CurD-like domain-containing protein [Streptomyces avicenniae]